jgi:hypothetical protein
VPVFDVLAALDRWITGAGVAASALALPVPGAWVRWTFPRHFGAAAATGLSALGPQALSAARRHVVVPDSTAV